MKKKIVLLDIDHTIFNTDSFREALFQKIADMYEEEAEYKDIPKISHVLCNKIISEYGFLDIELFLDQFLSEVGKKENREKIKQFLLDSALMEAHVHNDVLESLHELFKLSRIGILSQGENDYQRSKLKTFEHFLSTDIIHISKDKKSVMSEIFGKLGEDDIFFVDDTLSMLWNASKVSPDIKTIWMKRLPDTRGIHQAEIPGFSPSFIVNNLAEVVDIVRNGVEK